MSPTRLGAAPACRRARRRARACRRRQRQRARTAVTVVLPTPPLPATTSTRGGREHRHQASRSPGSAHSGGIFAQISDRPAHGRGRPSPIGRRRHAGADATTGRPDRSTCSRSAGCSTPSWSSSITDAIDDVDRRRRPGAHPAGQQPGRRRQRRRDGTTAHGAHRRGAACRSRSGSARPAPASTERPAQLLAVADVSGMAPGARVGHTGRAARSRRGHDRLRRRDGRGCAPTRSA